MNALCVVASLNADPMATSDCMLASFAWMVTGQPVMNSFAAVLCKTVIRLNKADSGKAACIAAVA
jgi:hypothetical protein